MQPKDPDSVTRDPQKKRGDEPGPRSQPHATTSDQIAEMESEGQAAKPGTSEQRAPTDNARPGAGGTEGTDVSSTDPDRSRSDQDIDTAGTEADPGSANARQVRKDPAGAGHTDDVRGDVAWQEPEESRRDGETARGTDDRQKKVLPH